MTAAISHRLLSENHRRILWLLHLYERASMVPPPVPRGFRWGRNQGPKGVWISATGEPHEYLIRHRLVRVDRDGDGRTITLTERGHATVARITNPPFEAINRTQVTSA